MCETKVAVLYIRLLYSESMIASGLRFESVMGLDTDCMLYTRLSQSEAVETLVLKSPMVQILELGFAGQSQRRTRTESVVAKWWRNNRNDFLVSATVYYNLSVS